MSIIPTLKERRAFNEKRRRSREGVSLNSIHHPEGDGIEPEDLNPESLETIEIEIPMTNEQASDWAYKMICCLGISTSNSDINVVGLHKTVKELYEQGRADEREAQVCCGDYDKCMKACTPRGRWLAEKELAKPWQGLTDEEIKEVLDLNETSWSLSGVALQHVMDDARALEAKLKEKNNAV
jgi:hypothetical protein